MLGYRLVSGDSIFIKRSFCPTCNHQLAWYDLMPVISWFVLRGHCRYCKTNISWLYPLIEIITPFAGILLLFYVAPHYWFGYLLFFSALLITIRTDMASLLISRFTSLYLIPVGIALSYFGLLPISITESIIGAVTAYLFLYGVSKTFTFITGKVGMGQGDIELLAMIGAFTGLLGWWTALVVGSFIGSIIGIAVLLFMQTKEPLKLPFGVFLSLGAMIYVLYGQNIISLLIP